MGKMEKYQITSELLTEAIWGANECRFIKDCVGYINSDAENGHRGRIILEYLLSRIYKIHRVPGYEPEYKMSFSDVSREIDGLTPEVLDEAEKEFVQIIRHVQEQVRKNKAAKDDTVELVRSIKPFECIEAIPQLLDGKETLTIPANIMSSYAYDGERFCYGCNISIKRRVPVSKILLWDKYIEAPTSICSKNHHLGEAEVWVLNDDIYGEISLGRSCFFVLDESKLESENKKMSSRYYRKNHRYDMDEKISNVYSIDDKPCENDDILTKWIMNRNEKKIKERYGIQ